MTAADVRRVSASTTGGAVPPSDKPAKSYVKGFAAASLAPSIAALFTNPIEVAKIRQQMDARPRGLMLTLRGVFESHGLPGIQAGLPMAVVREASKSFFRIGLFEPILHQLHDTRHGPAPIYKRMMAGASSGAIAALVCNPIELVKTRQQAAAAAGTASSFSYKGPLDGISRLYASEGLLGMWRGTPVSMLRSAAVTGPHLTTYTTVKEHMLHQRWMADTPPLHMLASLAGALAGICCNQPLDVVRNRLYSQPLTTSGEGTLYSGAADCALQLARAEGVGGFYRGFWSHYIRTGPHYCLTFIFLEQIKKALGT